MEVFDAPGVPIGLLPDSSYEDNIIRMQPGDRLCLHSDGLSEERNQDGEELGSRVIPMKVADIRNNQFVEACLYLAKNDPLPGTLSVRCSCP